VVIFGHPFLLSARPTFYPFFGAVPNISPFCRKMKSAFSAFFDAETFALRTFIETSFSPPNMPNTQQTAFVYMKINFFKKINDSNVLGGVGWCVVVLGCWVVGWALLVPLFFLLFTNLPLVGVLLQ
jgi:hypothetical protein